MVSLTSLIPPCVFSLSLGSINTQALYHGHGTCIFRSCCCVEMIGKGNSTETSPRSAKCSIAWVTRLSTGFPLQTVVGGRSCDFDTVLFVLSFNRNTISFLSLILIQGLRMIVAFVVSSKMPQIIGLIQS